MSDRVIVSVESKKHPKPKKLDTLIADSLLVCQAQLATYERQAFREEAQFDAAQMQAFQRVVDMLLAFRKEEKDAALEDLSDSELKDMIEGLQKVLDARQNN